MGAVVARRWFAVHSLVQLKNVRGSSSCDVFVYLCICVFVFVFVFVFLFVLFLLVLVRTRSCIMGPTKEEVQDCGLRICEAPPQVPHQSWTQVFQTNEG